MDTSENLVPRSFFRDPFTQDTDIYLMPRGSRTQFSVFPRSE